MCYGYTLVDELIPPHNIHINNQQDLSVATKHEYYSVNLCLLEIIFVYVLAGFASVQSRHQETLIRKSAPGQGWRLTILRIWPII